MASTVYVVFALTIVASLVDMGVSNGSRQRTNDQAIPPCESNPTVWRNRNMTCPDRAVCADVFDTVRNWYGRGGRPSCREHRVLHNCLCEDSTGGTYACPVDNDQHLSFFSNRQKSYTCERTCQLPYCNNLRQNPQSRAPVTAVSMILIDPEVGRGNYYRMECRCPRHHVPQTRPGIHRAVYPYSSAYDFDTHSFTTLYTCRGSGQERRLSDPCPPRTASPNPTQS